MYGSNTSCTPMKYRTSPISTSSSIKGYKNMSVSSVRELLIVKQSVNETRGH